MYLSGLFRNRISFGNCARFAQRRWAGLAPRSASRRNWQTEQLECRLLLTATPNGDKLRTYRLAVAATAEYTAEFGGGQLEAQQAIVTSVAIIFEGDPSADPFNANLSSTVLTQNQTLLDSVIGPANYDIGHVFGTFEQGGLATLNSVGNNVTKAQGASGTSSPTGSRTTRTTIFTPAASIRLCRILRTWIPQASARSLPQ